MDPAAPTQMDPMSWNAYVGMGANPMLYMDPDGRIKVISDGVKVMSETRGALANRAGEVDPSFYGKGVGVSTAIGVGVGNALIGISEFGLSALNVAVNVAVLQQKVMGSDVFGLAGNAAEELGQTAKTAASVYAFVGTDKKFEAYDASKVIAADAFAGEQTAIARSSEFVTSVLLPTNKLNSVIPTPKLGSKLSEASRIAESARMDATFARQLDADLARQGRVAEKIEPVVVVEGSGANSVATIGNKNQNTVPIIIGENMKKRVIPRAEMDNSEYFKPKNFPRDPVDTILENYLYIERAKLDNRTIIDIGPDWVRRKRDGRDRDGYEMENWQLRNYKNRVSEEFLPKELE